MGFVAEVWGREKVGGLLLPPVSWVLDRWAVIAQQSEAGQGYNSDKFRTSRSCFYGACSSTE